MFKFCIVHIDYATIHVQCIFNNFNTRAVFLMIFHKSQTDDEILTFTHTESFIRILADNKEGAGGIATADIYTLFC